MSKQKSSRMGKHVPWKRQMGTYVDKRLKDAMQRYARQHHAGVLSDALVEAAQIVVALNRKRPELLKLVQVEAELVFGKNGKG